MYGKSVTTSHGLSSKDRERVQDNPRVSQNQTFSRQCYTFASEATVHGVNRFVNRESGWLRRLLWLLLWLVMLAGLLNVIIAGTMKYLSRPFAVRVTYENIHNHTFPDVTICNNNMFRKSFYQRNPMAKLFFDDLEMVPPQVQDMPELFHWLHNTDLISTYYKGAIPAAEFVSDCYRGSQPVQCPNMTQSITLRGICYTLSAFVDTEGQPIVSSLPGMEFGYRFSVDVHAHDYTAEPRPSDGIGIIMAVHPNGVPPDLNTAFAVAPGTEQYVGLKVTQTSLLGQPYSEKCNSEKGYSQERCRMDCLVEHSVENCACDLVGNLPSVVNCSVAQSGPCYQAAYEAVYYAGDDGNCTCPLPCEGTTFTVELSTMKYPADAAVEKITARTGHSKEYLEKNIIEINLYFQSFIAQIVRQEPSYGLAEFAADVGGQMGLFLGASIISLAELLEFLVDLLLVLTNRQTIQPTNIQN